MPLITDKFAKSAPNASTLLSGDHTSVTTTLLFTQPIALPTTTPSWVTLLVTDASGNVTSFESVKGVYISGSNSLTLCTRGAEGTQQAWPANTKVFATVTAGANNDFVDGILTQHNPDGTHSAITATSLTTTGAITEGSTALATVRADTIFDHVSSGCVWSGDSYGSTLNASMTAGVVYIGGKRVLVSVVTARTFTGSQDTYVDVDNTGTLVYTTVANNAASPTLVANRVRIAIIVTGATNILNAGSVNQGQETMMLPIASSSPYAVTDSLGNLICPRDPNRKLLGYKQFTTGQSITTETILTGLTVPFIIPSGRKVSVTGEIPQWNINASSTGLSIFLRNGTTIAATQLNQATEFNVTGTTGKFAQVHWTGTLSAGLQNISLSASSSSSTLTITGGAGIITSLKIELL